MSYDYNEPYYDNVSYDDEDPEPFGSEYFDDEEY